MTLRQDRPLNGPPVVDAGPGAGNADSGPPTRSKAMGGLAALACAACCALPFLIAAGVLTGAGAALVQNVLLGVSGLLLAAAGGAWWLHRRRAARRAAAAGRSGCADGNCAC